MKREFLLALGGVMLSGCAGMPEMTRVAPAESYNVVVVDMLPEQPVHAHTGTTMFHNKTLPIEGMGWDIGEDVTARTSELLRESSHIGTVELANAQQIDRIPSDITAMGWSNITLAEEAVPAFTWLRDETNADLAIVLMPIRKKPDWQLTRMASGYGLYTRCFAEMCEARTLMHLHPFIVDLRSMQLAMNTAYIHSARLKTELEPVDLGETVDVEKALAGEQGPYLTPHYDHFVNSMMLKVRAHLEASGVLGNVGELKSGAPR